MGMESISTRSAYLVSFGLVLDRMYEQVFKGTKFCSLPLLAVFLD
jgi:hypothetical protein